MPKNIAIDFDGTLADSGLIKSKYLLENFGICLPPKGCNRSKYLSLIGEPAYKIMADYVYGREATLNTPAVYGASVALKELSKGAKLYVITARTRARSKVLPEWLAANNMEKWVVDVCCTEDHESKTAFCESIRADVLIDDDVRHLRGSTSRTLILFGSNEPHPDSMALPAATWDEVLRYLR